MSTQLKRKVLFEKNTYFWGVSKINNSLLMLRNVNVKNPNICKRKNDCNVFLRSKEELSDYFVCVKHTSISINTVWFTIEKNLVEIREDIYEREKDDYFNGKTVYKLLLNIP